ncbi:STAS domain-containing protein [Kitasatospora sp. NPDC056184]|uniref:STAS domain-containing protein n=1 Tax=Kitasatospora sp. NPDC056184 TaxID=3345738 RepID=UPI0035D66D51
MTRRQPRPPDATATAADTPVGLTVHARPWAHGSVLALRGELDLDSVAVLRRALDRALVLPGTVVVIDCGGLAFCDSTGVGALLEAAAHADGLGSRIELARPRSLVRRVLELTGATEAFPVHDTLPPWHPLPRWAR